MKSEEDSATMLWPESAFSLGAADKELLSLFSLVGSAWFFFSTVDSNPFTPRSQQLKLEFQPDI